MAKKLSPRMEDYLEAIISLQMHRPVARVTEIAEALSVSKPTVTSALKTLTDRDYIEHQSYGYIQLTEKGRKAARNVHQRHQLLSRFFQRVLGATPGRAVADACSAEHYISPDTLRRLTRFVEFIDSCPQSGPAWLECFHSFCDQGKERHEKEETGCEDCIERCKREVESASDRARRSR